MPNIREYIRFREKMLGRIESRSLDFTKRCQPALPSLPTDDVNQLGCWRATEQKTSLRHHVMNNFASKELLYREVNLASPNQRRRIQDKGHAC
jgi:hypothetical protein